MIYTTLFTIVALLFGIHFYKNRYPNEFDTLVSNMLTELEKNETLKPYVPFLSKLVYNIIYLYSFCQITFNKTIQFCAPYIQQVAKRIVEFSKNDNSNIQDTNTKSETKSKIVNSDYDIAIIKSLTDDMIILDKAPDNLDDIKYEISDIQFLSLYLKTNDEKTHIIELFNSYANYYVVNNKLDSNFFKYYLKNVLNIIFDSPFVYTLELMDQNVSMVYLNEKQSIVIKKDKYEILDSLITNDKLDSLEAELKTNDKLDSLEAELVTELVTELKTELVTELETNDKLDSLEAEPKILELKTNNSDCIYY